MERTQRGPAVPSSPRLVIPPRLFFWFNLLAAGALGVLLLLSPWLADRVGGFRLVELFGRDPVVRRTAVGAALALVVTARVFFDRPAAPRLAPRRPQKPAPGGGVGA